MARLIRTGSILQAAGLAALLAWLAPPAFAGEASYCITCANPSQSYRCRVVGDGAKANDAAKLYCIIRTAKEGHHSSCSAERSVANCAGVEKVYNYEGPSIPDEITSDPRAKSLANQVARDQQAFAKPKEGAAPKTMVELGGRAVSASRQGWRNARARIGGSESDPVPPPNGQPPLPLNAPPAYSASAGAEAAGPAPAATASMGAPAPLATENRAQRASSAVGGFARKSFRCMRTLFRKCSDEAADGQTLQ